jgi:cysteine desulfurase
MSLPDGPDFFAVSSHKIHGPKGVGALWIRDGVPPPAPLLHGGGQEQGLRSGTLSPALCAGFGAAAKLASERQKADQAHVSRLWDRAMEVFGPGWSVNGSLKQRYRGNLNIRREGLDGARLIAELRDIAFSLGSACASGSGRPSHVLRALGLSDREARGSIRLGFGRYTSDEELIDACRRIDAAARAQESFAA